jgi:hypothetical protein
LVLADRRDAVNILAVFIPGWCSGLLIGLGFRVWYYFLTNKDIPLLKVPTITYPNGSVEEIVEGGSP